MSDQPPAHEGDPRFPPSGGPVAGFGAPAGTPAEGGTPPVDRPAVGSVLAGAPTAHVVAAALLVAGVLVLVAMLLAMATHTTGRLGAQPAGFFERIRAATSFLDTSMLLLLPVVLVLVRHGSSTATDDGRPDGSAQPLTVGAGALSATFALFAVLGVVADQVGWSGRVGSRSVVLFADLATVVVAVASTGWAVVELQRRRPASSRPARPPVVPAAPGEWRTSPPPEAPGPPADWRPAPADPGWSDRPPIWPNQPPPVAPPPARPDAPPAVPEGGRDGRPGPGTDRPWSSPPL